jgi:hypothetical protein
MYEATINQWAVIIVAAATSLSGVVYGLVKRIELKEALDLIKTIKEVTHTSSEGGEEITVDEKIRIADEVIEILKR